MCSSETTGTSRRSARTTCMLAMSSFQLIGATHKAGFKLALVVALLGALAVHGAGPRISDPLVFVSRQIPPSGSIYWDVPRDMPGVGPHSRFRVAAPGRLLV